MFKDLTFEVKFEIGQQELNANKRVYTEEAIKDLDRQILEAVASKDFKRCMVMEYAWNETNGIRTNLNVGIFGQIKSYDPETKIAICSIGDKHLPQIEELTVKFGQDAVILSPAIKFEVVENGVIKSCGFVAMTIENNHKYAANPVGSEE